MILVRNLSLQPEEPLSVLPELAAKKLRIPAERILQWQLKKRSLDARKKDRIRYVCSVAVTVAGDEAALLRSPKLHGDKDVSPWSPPEYPIPTVFPAGGSADRSDDHPVVVGFGPAGMFAALVLSRAGLCPIVLERGQDAVTRKRAIEVFHAGGELDPENNVQFGEGGAGTFSDGKLNTGTHDPRISWVLEQFRAHGAPESVVYDARPHIGTDILIDVVQRIRDDVLSHGGEVLFGARMESLVFEDGPSGFDSVPAAFSGTAASASSVLPSGALFGASCSPARQLVGIRFRDASGMHLLPCRQLILAIGHSARDTFEVLHAQGIPMERKPFAMGVRIEHPQAMIDRAQYGRGRGTLPAADYGLHVHLPDGRGVFTFCMCPGGQVFAAASEQGGVVTNGMSYSARDGVNANSALLVGLKPEDFPGDGVLAGMYWQRELEQAAWRCGGGDYRAPAQLVGDFLAGHGSTRAGSVLPTYRPGVVWTDLRAVLPPVITDALSAALPLLGRQLAGFDHPEAVLTGPETRSSSPIRILRDTGLSSSVRGLYPCGEGAGYAGGITSAAVDGMRCAEAVIAACASEP